MAISVMEGQGSHWVDRDPADYEFSAQCEAKGEPVETFYPEVSGRNGSRAKQLCRACPVQQACLDYAIKYGEDHGIWGGYSVKERRVIKRAVREQGSSLIAMIEEARRS